ncbi:MAG: hypothetical protein AB7E36_09045 [Salinivirgaceae bacterium]
MDLQTRKLNVIEYLIGLKDEKIFSKIESTILESMQAKQKTGSLKSLTAEEIIDRANRSNRDYEQGNCLTQDELERKSLNW